MPYGLFPLGMVMSMGQETEQHQQGQVHGMIVKESLHVESCSQLAWEGHAVEQEAKRAAEAAARARQPAPAIPTLPASEAKPAAGSALPRSAPTPIAATGYLPAMPPASGESEMPQVC